MSETSRQRRRRRARGADEPCPCCGRDVTFLWTCRCGFSICQVCMDHNLWGMTCNNITWVCPDCGRSNGFGNQ